jgi:hypothetical protein
VCAERRSTSGCGSGGDKKPVISVGKQQDEMAHHTTMLNHLLPHDVRHALDMATRRRHVQTNATGRRSESKRHGDTNATGGKAVATEKRKRERNQTRQSTAEREQQRKSRCDSLPPLISSSRQRQRRKQHKRQQRNYKQEGNSDRGICGICRTEGGREKANPDSRGNRRTNCRSKRSTKQEPPR